MSEVKQVRESVLNTSISLLESISKNIGNDWAVKFSHDMLNGINEENPIERLNAWINWYNKFLVAPMTEFYWEERNGITVPTLSSIEKE